MRDKEMIINYIKNQKEHHKTVSFEEEYRQFIIESGGTIDERFFLGVITPRLPSGVTERALPSGASGIRKIR